MGWLRRHGLPLVLALLLILCGGVAPVWSLDPGAEVPGSLTQAESVAELQAGASLFEAHCVGCHVGGGNVIRRGRTLRLEALQRADLASPEAIARIAAEGRGQMGGYAAVLGEQGARQVSAWVWQQALAGWPTPNQG